MQGAPTDNNATLFAQGYDGVLEPKFNSRAGPTSANPPGHGIRRRAETEFQQAFTANPSANAVLTPNDENAAPIITYLQQQGVKPYTFPVTGQDATLVGLQNIISGYQCGTVYKPVFLEAQAAAALAMYLRAGITPPKSLINGTATDTVANKPVPSVLRDAGVGHPAQHREDDRPRQVRACLADLHGLVRGRLHEVQHPYGTHAGYGQRQMTADSTSAASEPEVEKGTRSARDGCPARRGRRTGDAGLPATDAAVPARHLESTSVRSPR